MARNYFEYSQKLAREARAHDDAKHAAKVDQAARRKAKRLEMQPMYDAAVAKQKEELQTLGLSVAVANMDARLNELDTIWKNWL